MNRQFSFLSAEGNINLQSLGELEAKACYHLLAEKPFILEYSEGPPPRKWEKIIYPLLGLKIPLDTKALYAYPTSQGCALVFEDREKEWISNFDSESKKMIKVTTVNGERFELPAKSFLKVEEVFPVLSFFYIKRKRPSIVSKRNA